MDFIVVEWQSYNSRINVFGVQYYMASTLDLYKTVPRYFFSLLYYIPFVYSISFTFYSLCCSLFQNHASFSRTANTCAIELLTNGETNFPTPCPKTVRSQTARGKLNGNTNIVNLAPVNTDPEQKKQIPRLKTKQSSLLKSTRNPYRQIDNVRTRLYQAQVQADEVAQRPPRQTRGEVE